MSKFSSTLPIISLLLLVIGVRSQVVPTSLYIDCGNPNNSTNSFKNITWMNDGFYAVQTGSVATVIKAPEVKQQTIMQKILGIKPKSPKPIPKPYNTYRSGKIIAYHIPVAKTPTKYNVTLYFYEPNATIKVDERKMNIEIEQLPHVVNFDIVKESKSSKRDFVTKAFTVTVVDGTLSIKLTSDTQAIISAISVQAYTAIRIRAGTTDYKDKRGNVWTMDKNFASGGGLWGPTFPFPNIDDTADDPLYLMERNGDFRYYFWGINNGLYTVRLHFAELFFTNQSLRVFNVSVQEKVALSNVDIFKMAKGSKNRALILETKAQVDNGLLVVEFDGIKNFPKVCGVEII